MSTARGVSSLERLEAILRNPAVYELAKLIPNNKQTGRKRVFPNYMLFVYDALLSVYGSARNVETELSHPYVWKFMRRLVKKLFSNEPRMWLPSQHFRRHHYEYGRNRYLTDPEIFDQVQELHRQLAAQQAQELGLLDPEGEGSFTHPHESRMIYADGKVITPLYKAKPGERRVDKQTGEIKNIRFEADADLHWQGDGEIAYGTKFLMTAVRTPDIHGRIILDVQWVANKGGEAKTAMQSFHSLAPEISGCQGVIYDTALRGTHHQQLLRELGWLSINRVQAQTINKKKGQIGARIEKTVHIEDRKIGNQTVRLFAQGGTLGIAELDDQSKQHFTPLQRLRTIRKHDKNEKFRWYNEYKLPNGPSILMRLDQQDTDTARKLNRTENLRPIPPGDPDFERLYRRRNDIESINRNLEDTLFLGRAHSKGHARQLMNLLGYALMVNGLALYKHRKRRDELLAA